MHSTIGVSPGNREEIWHGKRPGPVQECFWIFRDRAAREF